MKRLLAALLTMVALTACASPLAKSETPQQALSATAQRSSQLKSAKFDFAGHVTLSMPAAMAQMLGQNGSATGTMAVDMSGTGEAQFPDRYHAVVNIKLGGFSVASETIVANGKSYVKNPMTGKWEVSQGGSMADQLGQPDPLSYAQFLKNVKAIKDLGDTTINGTAVHHYQLTPDKDKLLAGIDASKSPQAAATMRQVLNNGTLLVDVWFGKDDHLVRRVSTNMDYTLDLNQLLGSLGSPSGSLPPGSSLHAVGSLVINLHDFDAPVTISIPSVG